MAVNFPPIYQRNERDVPEVSTFTLLSCLLLLGRVDRNAIEMQMFALRQRRSRVSVYLTWTVVMMSVREWYYMNVVLLAGRRGMFCC